MLKVSLFVLLSVACLIGQSLAQINATAIDEALAKGQQLEDAARIKVETSFPSTERGMAAGKALLETMHTGLSHCADELRQTNNISLYERCCGSIEALTWLSYGEIAREEWAVYGATSGASRMGFFLW